MAQAEDPQPPLTRDAEDEREWMNAENWKLGMFYYSQKDRRIWVPKRTMFGRRRRFGGTPNFAKPAARRYILIITLLFVGLMGTLMLLRKLEILH